MANFVLDQRTINRLYLSIEQRSHVKVYMAHFAYSIIMIIDNFQSYIHLDKTCTQTRKNKRHDEVNHSIMV